jgi:predicted RNA-binding Zn ribbon-like protein
MTVSRPPWDLELVIDFVNTRDLETGQDELGTPAELAAWLGRRLGISPSIGPAELSEATGLREALRAEMLAHNGAPRDPASAEALERVAERGALSVRFCADGPAILEPRDRGFAGVLARLLVPVAHAAGAGTWDRVKACRAEDCQAAFYDRSRNRSGHWCDMAVCGNRSKVRTYRSRRTSG